MTSWKERASARLPSIIATIQAFVACESPSDSPSAIDRFVELLVETARPCATPTVFPAEGFGSHLLLQFETSLPPDANQILALGHSDTVWPLGTLAHMPFRQADGRLWGPGVLDMKGGLALFLHAMLLIEESGIPLRRRVVLLVVSDEEVGSPSSRALTEESARASECVLVLEPGTGLDGKLKTARKGVAGYRIHVHGVASHAGVDFEKGASAVLEAARQVERLAALSDPARGITVNPGVIRGGTRSNVVADAAVIDVDVRTPAAVDAEALHKQIYALKAVDGRCTVTVEGGLNRPPMQRTPAIAELFGRAATAARTLGFNLDESSTGGGSDGNFTAALGIPTLDGLGAVGEGAHAAHESIILDRIAERTALLALLLTSFQ